MNPHFLRVYKKMDIQDIKEHLLICGDLSASCEKCKAINLKIDAVKCPECQSEFKYIAFRNIKSHWPKLPRIAEERPHLNFIDFDDYTRITGALKAREFLK